MIYKIVMLRVNIYFQVMFFRLSLFRENIIAFNLQLLLTYCIIWCYIENSNIFTINYADSTILNSSVNFVIKISKI